MQKDIILIIGGGGMSGIFSAGVLKSFEEDEIYNRIYSIYAVSVGACTGARFLARESELGAKTFYTWFNDNRFIKGNFVKYFFQILRRKKAPDTPVDDIFDFDYFTEVLLTSEDKIDMEKVATSSIPFYVKIFNNTKKVHQYVLVKGPHAYGKVLASASMTPLTSRQHVIDGEEVFDGDTIPSDIEEGILKANPEKLIIKIDNSRSSFLGDFNLFFLFIVYTLLRSVYGAQVSGLYFKNFFKRPFWRIAFRRHPNVLVIENGIQISPFCKDEALLKKVYREGLKKGGEVLAYLDSHPKKLHTSMD